MLAQPPPLRNIRRPAFHPIRGFIHAAPVVDNPAVTRLLDKSKDVKSAIAQAKGLPDYAELPGQQHRPSRQGVQEHRRRTRTQPRWRAIVKNIATSIVCACNCAML